MDNELTYKDSLAVAMRLLIHDDVQNKAELEKKISEIKPYDDTEIRNNVSTLKEDLTTVIRGKMGVINVCVVGLLDNTYTSDNADKLQALIDTVPNGSTLYFPRGKYKLSHGVTVNKNLAFVGECMPKNLSYNDDGKFYGSFLVFDDDVENETMITQGTSSWHMPIERIGLVAHACKWVDNGINDSEVPYEEYTVETIKENVNAVYYRNTGTVPVDCIISGFSGYGVRTTQAQNLNNVHFRHCNRAILQETNDLMLHGGYITQCKTAIYMTKGNIFIDGTYIDLIADHAIECTTYLSGKLDVYIDHTGFSGIYAKGFNHVSGSVKLGRTGMYYGGKTIDELKVSSSGVEELENFKKASGICTDIIQNSTLSIDAIPRNVSDSASSTKETPILGFYTQKAFGAVLTGANLSVLLRWQTDEKTNMIVVTDKAITKYTKGKTEDLGVSGGSGTITESDYDAIADKVIEKLPSAEGASL